MTNSLDWFKALNVESIDLWIEGAYKSGNRIELFLSVEGKTGAKLTLRPYAKRSQAVSSVIVETPSVSDTSTTTTEPQNSVATPVKVAERSTPLVTAFFSPQGGIERHVVSLINSAIGSIEMAAYEFTNIYIEKALLEAVKRGVKVAIVLDRSQTQGRQAMIHDMLEKAGTDIRLSSPPKGIMHDKYIIVDGKTVQWGSYNYTERAENSNCENATFASDSTLSQQYHSDSLSLYNQAKPESHGIARPIRRFIRVLIPKGHEE